MQYEMKTHCPYCNAEFNIGNIHDITKKTYHIKCTSCQKVMILYLRLEAQTFKDCELNNEVHEIETDSNLCKKCENYIPNEHNSLISLVNKNT